MEVYIDGEKQNASNYDSDDDLVELLAEVKSHLDDAIVYEVKVDGQSVDPNRPELNPELDKVEKIDIELKKIQELMSETVENLYNYAPRVTRALKKAQEEFKLGDEEKGYKLLEKSLYGLEWCLGVTVRLENLSKGKNLSDTKQEINCKFQEVKQVIDASRKLKQSSFLANNLDRLIPCAEGIETMAYELHERINGNGELDR